jgi:hypothetical protein
LGLELVLFAGLAVGAVGLIMRVRDRGAAAADDWLGSPDRRSVALVVLLALATPIGVIFVSLVSHSLLLPRNLGTSSPYLLIAVAAMLASGPRVTRLAAISAVVLVFAIGAYRTTQPHWQRPDVKGAADLVDAELGPDDVVFDVVVPISPPNKPPTLTLDVQLDEPHVVVEPRNLEEINEGIDLAQGRKLAIVGPTVFTEQMDQLPRLARADRIYEETFDGAIPTTVNIYEIPARGE